MALTGSLNLTVTPIKLTVTSDKRKVSAQIAAVGESLLLTGTFPVTVTDAARTWTIQSDDGVTAVYTA